MRSNKIVYDFVVIYVCRDANRFLIFLFMLREWCDDEIKNLRLKISLKKLTSLNRKIL